MYYTIYKELHEICLIPRDTPIYWLDQMELTMNQPGKRTSIVRRLMVQRLPVAVYASRVNVKQLMPVLLCTSLGSPNTVIPQFTDKVISQEIVWDK